MSDAVNTSPFKTAVNESMRRIAKLPQALFVGQSVKYDGAAIYDSLDGINPSKRIECPVVENLQLGFCVGLALAGKLPVCIYPRMDFMLLAMDALVNHLDKLPMFGWHPKVIIRTTIGQKRPLDAGPQHTQDHTKAFQLMLHTVSVHQVQTPQQVLDAYERAIESSGATLIIENPCL